MRIQLDVEYISNYLFSPVYSLDARLLAVEMTGRFHSPAGNLVMPQTILLSLLDRSQKVALFKEQLLIIRSKASWFRDNQVMVLLKIDRALSELVIRDEKIKMTLKEHSFIQLEINEIYPNLNEGKENPNIFALSKSFNLWLDNFGSGKTNLKPFYDGLFRHVKLDARFVQRLLTRPTDVSMINPMLNVIKKHNPGMMVIAQGIDTPALLEKSYDLDIRGVQGQLWPAVPLEQLDQKLPVAVCYG
ncbi:MULTISPECIES: EAL domain-containing protein [Lonsdalea]|uniref:Diguanylate phosphodiesterase n=2 Tax=Lonsdalea TaxID=1082702 RepID=A0ACD1J977_9GAMM|nr:MULTISPECIES: EAL domain-containing protein [Lonsdalea]OSM99460.1 diguanylate phosphodiesterase [Lonsdalea populi]OSN02773.1 diguanylate phosphodiesterase [Lonsdalea populi]QPQ25463.1 EAL domain-containing protein [Lonsdalea populi]RAT10916.1 diguanylate phosphodiesterase [Lonsdalea quercina]RAT15254.1 diguanylate phosphodiesterase [Lonsdalea quercina]